MKPKSRKQTISLSLLPEVEQNPPNAFSIQIFNPLGDLSDMLALLTMSLLLLLSFALIMKMSRQNSVSLKDRSTVSLLVFH